MVRSRRPWCLKGVALGCSLAVSQLTSSFFQWIRNIARSYGENDLRWDPRRRQSWGNGKSAHADPHAKFLFYGITKGVFGGFGLDGAALKRDASGNQALYGKNMTTYEVIDQTADKPEIVSRFISRTATGVDHLRANCDAHSASMISHCYQTRV